MRQPAGRELCITLSVSLGLNKLLVVLSQMLQKGPFLILSLHHCNWPIIVNVQEYSRPQPLKKLISSWNIYKVGVKSNNEAKQREEQVVNRLLLGCILF